MPVTFKVSSHPAAPLDMGSRSEPPSALELFHSACPEQWHQCAELLQSSILDEELPSLQPRSNGFVHTVLQAYNTHQHLVIRPDDVWIAILSQLSYYAHPEEMGSSFAGSQLKRRLNVVAEESRYTVDFASMARQITSQLEQYVIDQRLTRWVLPDFTTTTLVDTTICSLLMMSSLNSYFEFSMVCACGIPSVTLDGGRADWQKLLDRMDRLETLGEEPKAWVMMLRPILRRFVSAFEGRPDIFFWEHVAHYDPSFYGQDDVSGWITAFCVWSSKGRWQVGSPCAADDPSSEVHSVRLSTPASRLSQSQDRCLVLDGVAYPQMSALFIPEGFCEVDVTLSDQGLDVDCLMVAGHIAMAVTSRKEGGEPDTVAPAPQWLLMHKEKHQRANSRSDLLKWDFVTAFPMETKYMVAEYPEGAARSRKVSCVGCTIS